MVNLQTYPTPVSRVAGLGIELPERVVSNFELIEMLDSPEDVKKRLLKLLLRVTGVKARRYADPRAEASDLACTACRRACEAAGVELSQIDTLIFSATDMDMLEPSTANILQKKLGIPAINAFDVTNACNSFLQGMNVANSLIASGAARRVMIASGEIGSQWCNRTVRSTEELDVKMGGLTLGDAGAAVIMEKSDGSSGLTEINLMNIGEYWEACHVPERTDWRSKGERNVHGWFYLDMPKLAKIAKEATVDYFKDYMAYRRRSYSEKSFFDSLAQIIPHQISPRFIDDIGKAVYAKVAGVDFKRVSVTADIYGNTASTAIPVALAKLIDDGVLEWGRGQEVLLYGAASGFGIGHVRLHL